MNIQSVRAWRILDSRGNPTVACEVALEDGSVGYGDAPAGASTGSHEAHESRDGEAAFGGRDVTRAIQGVNTEIAAALTEQGIKSPKGKDFWRAATIRGILRNEKYCGDALMQKTCTIDFREHKSVKNTMLNKYFKEEHHTAIIKKSDWQKVQQILDEKPLPGKSARLHAMPKRFTVTRSKDKYFRGYIILDPRWTASERRELLKELKTL